MGAITSCIRSTLRLSDQASSFWKMEEGRGLTLAGYHKGTPELRERAYQTLLAHGGAMQNYELAELARRENWPIHHAKMWGTHGLLNTLREEGRVVRVGRGRYAVAGHTEASIGGGWSVARLRIAATTRQTVAASGTTSRRRAKEKQLRAADLLAALDSLALKQDYRCAQTGVVFDEADPDLRASLDRIDSDGHYEDGSITSVSNLQLVTHWYNMAKGVRSTPRWRVCWPSMLNDATADRPRLARSRVQSDGATAVVSLTSTTASSGCALM